jgi:restriction system protein
MPEDVKMSKSLSLATKVIFAAMTILKENGRELPMRELMNKVERRVELDSWAKARYEKSGYIRWESILHFFSIDCIKAGYLLKKKGIWYLTPEGEEALKLGAVGLMQSVRTAYRKWKEERGTLTETSLDTEEELEKGKGVTFEEIEQTAIEGLENYINSKNPYEFQDIVAALLRGMGYYTPFIAPKGKDGGLDVTAYRDPLGTESPRIQVQIKHRENPASVQEVRQLMGLLQKEGDVGIFVSSGGFTLDAKNAARSSHIHVELIDLPRFFSLWQDFYNKLSEEDKSLLPLRPIYFLASKP